jgi:glycine/D-amino acid oxidase-like deaminating enzyme/nitrite reductase/ring-hydroxylating ferredoxin subunit
MSQHAQNSVDLKSIMHGSIAENPWGQAKRQSRFPKLQKDLQADVCIVGGGMAGLTTALALLKSGKSVVVLESKVVGSGNSGRHTGELTTWKKAQYSSMHQMYDKETVVKIAESHEAAIRHVEQIVKELGIECGLKRLDAFVFTYAGSDAQQKVQRELSAAKDAGLKNVSTVDDYDLGKESGKLDHAVQFPDTIVMDPIRYIEGLADAVAKAGGQIFEQSRVRDPSSKKCTTMEGHSVHADDVVIATATPITHNLVDSGVRALAVHGKHTPKRRYAVAMSLPTCCKEGVYYDLDYPPYSVRVTDEGGDSLQVVVSGEEHDQGIPADEYADYHARLEAWARNKWPALSQPTHRWSFQMFETTEYLSFHGKDPSPVPNRSFYISYGDNGETLTSATLGGMIIADQILGKPNKFSELYSPSRSMRGAPGLPPISLSYVKNTVQSIVGQVVPKLSNPDIEDMLPDSGAIIQKDVNKLAVYKDENGTAHAYSAVCPHLGCLVQWNPIEKQWNCPCHGSCFDKTGTNIGGGPSTIDMGSMDGVF